MGWKRYLEQRETDERRRRRERANAEKKAGALMAQADKMRAKATKAVAAQNMARRAEKLLAGLEDVRVADKVAKVRFPTPAPCGKTPLTAHGLSKSYGSLEIFTDVDVAVDRGSRVAVLGPQRRRQDHPAADARPACSSRTPARCVPGHGLRLGYYAQEHETLDVDRTVLEHMRAAAPDADRHRAAQDPRRVPVLRRRRRQAGRRALRRREDPAGAGHAGLLRRQRAAAGRADQQPRPGQPGAGAGRASRRYPGAIVLVTHDPGAVLALKPDRAILLPDGVEDAWSDDLLDLVELA